MSSTTTMGKQRGYPITTIIPTPTGDMCLGAINVGDYVYGINGKPTKVVAVMDHPIQENIYSIEFMDSRAMLCTIAQPLIVAKLGSAVYTPLTLEEIINTTEIGRDGYIFNSKYKIPNNEPISASITNGTSEISDAELFIAIVINTVNDKSPLSKLEIDGVDIVCENARKRLKTKAGFNEDKIGYISGSPVLRELNHNTEIKVDAVFSIPINTKFDTYLPDGIMYTSREIKMRVIDIIFKSFGSDEVVVPEAHSGFAESLMDLINSIGLYSTLYNDDGYFTISKPSHILENYITRIVDYDDTANVRSIKVESGDSIYLSEQFVPAYDNLITTTNQKGGN